MKLLFLPAFSTEALGLIFTVSCMTWFRFKHPLKGLPPFLWQGLGLITCTKPSSRVVCPACDTSRHAARRCLMWTIEGKIPHASSAGRFAYAEKEPTVCFCPKFWDRFLEWCEVVVTVELNALALARHSCHSQRWLQSPLWYLDHGWPWEQ